MEAPSEPEDECVEGQYDFDGDEAPADKDLDGWDFAHSESESDENDAEPHAPVSDLAKHRPEYKELAALGLAERPRARSIGVHMANSMWRAGTPTSPCYGRSWGPSTGRSAKQALIRVLILMWGHYCDENPGNKLAHKLLSRLSKLWADEPGKP